MRAFALAALAYSSPALAECPGDCANTVQVDPLTVALGFVHVQVEGRLAPHWSVYAGPSLHLFNLGEQEPYIGLGVEAGGRYFFKPTAPKGFWLSVRQVAAYLYTTNGSGQKAIGGYSSALIGGTLIHKRLVLAGGVGVQRMYYGVGNYGIKGTLPAAHTTVGFAF